MKRISPKSITVKSNLKVDKVYPLLETKKAMDELKTIGIQLSKSQAVDLARILLAVSQEWDEIDLTFYRHPTSEGKFRGTITTMQ
jgi:hypothetical protein